MTSDESDRLAELHMLGPETSYTAIRSGVDQQRPWLSRAPVCEQLRTHRIIHTGLMHARAPLKVVRMHQSGTYFMVTVSGAGEVLVDGKWQKTGPEQGCLLPPRYPNAFRAVPGKETWTFFWVRYLEPDSQMPITTSSRPVLENFPSAPMGHAFQGLLAAAKVNSSQPLMHHWVELIHGYVQEFAGPVQHDDRIWRAWEIVQEDIDAEWDLDSIAKNAHVSAEHFRRMCQKHLGRSPMKHLAFLRIQAGMQLLSESNATIESIAKSVGYHTAASFAKAFRKWTGHRPSDLR